MLLCVCHSQLWGCQQTFPSRGCCTGMPLPSPWHQGAAQMPTNPCQIQTGISTFAGSSCHLCPHHTDQRERVLEVLVVWLEHGSEQPPAVLCAGWTSPWSSTHSLTGHSSTPTAGTPQECLEPTPESNRTKGPSHTSRAQHTHTEFFPHSFAVLAVTMWCAAHRTEGKKHQRSTTNALGMKSGWGTKTHPYSWTLWHVQHVFLKEPPPATVKTREEWTLGKGKHPTGRSALNRTSPQSRILEETQEHWCDCIHPYLFHDQAAHGGGGVSIPGWI